MCSSPIFYNLTISVDFFSLKKYWFFISTLKMGRGQFRSKIVAGSFFLERKCQRKQGVGQSSFGVFFLRKFIQIERFKSTFKTYLKKWQKKCNHITMDDLRKAISGDILKATVEKSQTNVASATMNHLRKAISRDIWKRTLEKSETNATNVTMHYLRQAIWGLMCRKRSNKCNQFDIASF